MNSHVINKLASIRKLIATNFTRAWLFSVSILAVNTNTLNAAEHLSTLSAWNGLLVS